MSRYKDNHRISMAFTVFLIVILMFIFAYVILENRPVLAAPLSAVDTPDLRITKDDGGVSVGAGDTIQYTLTFTNTGPADATGVVITDTVPTNTTFDESLSTFGWSCADGDPAGSVCVYDIAAVFDPVSPGSSGQLSFAVEVDRPIATGVNAIFNAVAIGDDGASGPDPNPGDNFDIEVTQVINQAPIITIDLASVTVSEGQSAINGGTVNDPDDDPISLSASVGTVTNNGNGSWSWSFATEDGPADSQAVTIYADDSRGGTSQADFDLIVDNLPPEVGQINAPTVPVDINDQPILVTAVFTDPGVLDTHIALWDWGDSAQCDTSIDTDCSLTQGAGSGSVSGSHTYSYPGVYTVKLNVTDNDFGIGESVFQYVVVYDQQGGFVTGGGWIDSPEGAYKPDPSLTGKATFGFVSKYKKGATRPTGSTEFKFKTADLNFNSSDYDWLVVTGGDYARFKGTGTINGAGEYKFMLWAGDGEPDTFRIKIWQEDDAGNESVIYDNGFDRAIAGGSIVVHTK